MESMIRALAIAAAIVLGAIAAGAQPQPAGSQGPAIPERPARIDGHPISTASGRL